MLAVYFLTQCVLVLPAIVHRNFAKAVAQTQGDASALPSLGEQVQDILFNFAQRQMPVQYSAVQRHCLPCLTHLATPPDQSGHGYGCGRRQPDCACH